MQASNQLLSYCCYLRWSFAPVIAHRTRGSGSTLYSYDKLFSCLNIFLAWCCAWVWFKFIEKTQKTRGQPLWFFRLAGGICSCRRTMGRNQRPLVRAMLPPGLAWPRTICLARYKSMQTRRCFKGSEGTDRQRRFFQHVVCIVNFGWEAWCRHNAPWQARSEPCRRSHQGAISWRRSTAAKFYVTHVVEKQRSAGDHWQADRCLEIVQATQACRVCRKVSAMTANAHRSFTEAVW